MGIGQIVAAGDHRFAGTDGAQRNALLLKPRSGGPVNGASHPTANTQLGVGRVDDGTQVQLSGDVPLYGFYGDVTELALCHDKPLRSKK